MAPQAAEAPRRATWLKFTRGFTGRSKAARDPRLPPGQYDVGADWPVLTAEVTPKLDVSSWTFKVEGLVAKPATLELGRNSRPGAILVQR